MKVAVIILNWNGKKLLEKFLPSVIKHSKNAEIIIADNNSTDNSICFLESNYPEVRIIKNKGNYGYAKGYNESLKKVDADIFVLLNSDVEVTENWINPIEEKFEKEKDLAIVQPKILNYNNKNKFDYAGGSGGFIDKYGYPYCRGRVLFNIEQDTGQYNDEKEIDWASGACLFIRKKVYNLLEGLDEDFYLHMEEIDMCLRAKALGLKIKVVPSSIVYHMGGGTLGKRDNKKVFYNFRNSLYNIVKNYKDYKRILFFRIVILDSIAGILFLFKLKFKNIFAIVRAHFSFYRNFLSIYLKRKKKLFKAKEKRFIIKDYYTGKKTYK